MKTRNALLSALVSAGILSGVSTQADAAAIAQAYLKITDFTISSTAFPDGITFNNSFDASSELNGTPATPVATGTSDTAVIGSDSGAYNPGVAYLFDPANHMYAGGFAEITGDARLGGADSLVDTTVSLRNPADGSAQANSGVTASADFTIADGSSVEFIFSMFASAFIRADLDQANTFAVGDIGWELNIFDDAGDAIFTWAPTEINRTRTVDSIIDDRRYTLNETLLSTNFTLTESGNYQLSIRHETNADARWVPEPASLALIGLGLVGMSAMRRRKQVA